jgi:2'-5' RNA ligase
MSDIPSTARLFLALWPDPVTLDGLAARRDAIAWDSRAKVQPLDRIHLTLHFIGQVPRARIPAIQEALQLPGGDIFLNLTWLDVWTSGIAVLRPRELPPALLALQAALAERLRDLGLPVEEREFKPHVTLARNAPGAADPGGQPVRWASSGYTLCESRGGYHVLQHYA